MLSSNSIPIKSPRKIFSKDLPSEPDAIIENERNTNLDTFWCEKAEKELGETCELSNMKIKQLRHLLSVGEILVKGRTDQAFLLRFLRAKKFDCEKSYRMIQKYYTMKQRYPELFTVSPPSQMSNMLKMQIQYMLPHRDTNGRQVYIFRVEKCEPYKCPVETVFRTNVLALENAIRDPKTQISGVVVLLDMAGVGLGHARFLSPHLAKRTVDVIQEAFPMRFKAFHILHEPFYFDAILAVLRPFLKEKISKRIHLHGNSLTSLYKHIPKEILPSEYGGDQPSFDNTNWREQILNDEDYFNRLESNISNSLDNKFKDNGSCCSTSDGTITPNLDTETEDSENDEDDIFYETEELDKEFNQDFGCLVLNGYKENDIIDVKEKGVEDVK